MRKFIFLLITAFMAMMCVISCDVEQSGSGESGGESTPVTPKTKHYTIRFNANDGSGNMTDLSADVGSEVTLPACTFTAPIGNKFGKWNTAANGSGSDYADRARVTDLTTDDEAVVTLYAIWIEKESHSIQYLNVKGTNSNVPSFKETDTIVLKDLTADGYTFGGWYDSSTDFSDAHHITGWTAGAKTANVILWGKWTANEVNYTVKTLFQNVSGSGYDESGDAVTKKGLTDSTTDATAGNVTGFELQTIVQQVIAGNGSTVVEIKYNRKNIAYTFKANGGKWSDDTTADKTVNGLFGASVNIPTVTRVGYTFNQWDNEVPTVFGSENKTFTAQWNGNQYEITYKDQGDAAFSGTHGDNHPVTHTYGTATTLVSPTKTNYLFGGWYDNAECSGSALTELGATAFTANITLYAKWSLGYECTVAV